MAQTDSVSAPAICGEDERWTISWWVAVSFLGILALLLRVFAIDHESLWYDEAVTCQSVNGSALDLLSGRVMYDFGNPPIYFVLGSAWRTLFGDSEIGLRSFPAFTGALTVPLLALLGRQLVNSRVGLWGAFLLAISPTAIELSNEARPYSLVGLLAVVATYLFVRWMEKNRGLDLALYAVAVSLVCDTHYYGVAVPVAHAASLFVLPREHRRLRAWFGAMVVAGLLSLPVLTALLTQLSVKGNLSRMGDRWMYQFLATPMVFGFGRNLAWRDSPAWLLLAITLAALTCFWLPALFAISRYRRSPFVVVLLGFWALVPVIVPLVVAITLSPIYATRYAVVGLPAFVILAGWGLEQLHSTARTIFVIPIMVLTSMSLYCYATTPLKDDWRAETRFVLDRMSPGELVVFTPQYEIETFLYYASRRGAVPTKMIGLTTAPGANGDLPGILYRDGVRFDANARDCTDSVLSSSGIWLVCCASRDSPESFRAYLRETASGWLRIGIHIESRYFASRGRSARTIRAMIQSDGVEPTNRRRCRSGWSPPYPPAEGCGDFYPASSVNFYGCDTRWLDGLLHKPLTVRGGNVWQPKLKFRRVLGW